MDICTDPLPCLAQLLPREAFLEILWMLRRTLPPPLSDDPAELERRDRAKSEEHSAIGMMRGALDNATGLEPVRDVPDCETESRHGISETAERQGDEGDRHSAVRVEGDGLRPSYALSGGSRSMKNIRSSRPSPSASLRTRKAKNGISTSSART